MLVGLEFRCRFSFDFVVGHIEDGALSRCLDLFPAGDHLGVEFFAIREAIFIHQGCIFDSRPRVPIKLLKNAGLVWCRRRRSTNAAVQHMLWRVVRRCLHAHGTEDLTKNLLVTSRIHFFENFWEQV